MAGMSRTVTVTGADIGILTARELVQACRVVGVRRAEVQGLLAQAQDDYGDPDETARAVEATYGRWPGSWSAGPTPPPPGRMPRPGTSRWSRTRGR